jgi:CheY-like chemotaxis protein
MVVDDAVSELKMIESILKAAGHQVISYQDGEQLEDHVVEERPDVLLLDIVMPKRNGYEVLRGIRRDPRTKDTPSCSSARRTRRAIGSGDSARGRRTTWPSRSPRSSFSAWSASS